MLPDSSAIETALVGVLAADATLTALVPDGVFYGQAAPGKSRFVVVSLILHQDHATFGVRALEEANYLVKAVVRGTVSATQINHTKAVARQAAARIDGVLENATIPIAGYGPATIARRERVAYPERDDVDPTILWQHAGGQYHVLVAPIAT